MATDGVEEMVWELAHLERKERLEQKDREIAYLTEENAFMRRSTDRLQKVTTLIAGENLPDELHAYIQTVFELRKGRSPAARVALTPSTKEGKG